AQQAQVHVDASLGRDTQLLTDTYGPCQLRFYFTRHDACDGDHGFAHEQRRRYDRTTRRFLQRHGDALFDRRHADEPLAAFGFGERSHLEGHRLAVSFDFYFERLVSTLEHDGSQPLEVR